MRCVPDQSSCLCRYLNRHTYLELGKNLRLCLTITASTAASAVGSAARSPHTFAGLPAYRAPLLDPLYLDLLVHCTPILH